jgi:tRNA-splicing ligase RtcB
VTRRALHHEDGWKSRARRDPAGFYALETADTGEVPVRLFLTPELLADAEESLYRQIVNATAFPGARLVVITPDVHHGYGVPVGCVIATDRGEGAVAMGPVGFDIGCGMMSARSAVPADRATPDRRLAFNREVMARVPLGAGGTSTGRGRVSERALEALVRGGAEEYLARHGGRVDRGLAERHRLPVRDTWDVPWGQVGAPERGLHQLGTLGGGNHFVELQRSEETGTLFVQVHTGSRGFGHGLATHYFARARDADPTPTDPDLGHFTPDSPLFEDYLDAVAAGGNYAIVNRLILFEEIAEAFRKVFREDLSLVYEISHNLVQAEDHPGLGAVWVHRKGATRALPAGHAALAGTPWAATGHPVLVPGSNRDHSYILRPAAGAVNSACSVNHGAGRRMSRGEASRRLDQRQVDEQYRRDGVLVNVDGRVPLDEAAQCYKSAAEVVRAVTSAGLATVEHTLWPLASVKGTEEGAARDQRRERRDRERRRDEDRRDARRGKRGR